MKPRETMALAVTLALWGCSGGSAPAPTAAVPASPPHEAPLKTPAKAAAVATSVPPPRVAADPCDAFADLEEREERDLTVPVEPQNPRPELFGRMRHHADGSLSRGASRVWFGPRVPRFVPLYEGSSELHLLETVGDGYVAMYRDPYGAGSCDLRGGVNCRVVIVGYERCGQRTFTRDLREVMSRPTLLEVQDLRVADGIVYFNEACQSYARDAGGKCSSLIALDPASGQVRWRTKPLVSNNRILVVGGYVVAGYGFTAEPDHVSLVRRRDGVVTSRAPLASAHEDLKLEGDTLVVRIYPGNKLERFTLTGLDGDAAKITKAR